MMLPAREDRRYRAQLQAPTKTFQLPAPTGGINARDAYTDMDEHDAVDLVNVFPEASYCAVRKGNATWATGMGAFAIRSLMTWQGLTGVDKMFAGVNNKIYDVTAQGAVGAASVSGLTNADFQWTNLENSGGMYLIAVNGADSLRAYDGSTWSIPVITVATSSTFANVIQFKERLWFSVVNSLDTYYLPVQAIAGAAALFPLGAVFRRGGHVVGLGTFSNDSGDGPDDYLGFVTSNGEVAIYQGTDPTSATTWALMGRFDIGLPIGRRCCIRWNGDMGVLTQDGIVSMRAALQFSRESIQKASITGKIQTLFSFATASYGTNFGWSMMTFPAARYLIVNVPNIENSTQTQFVMNTITGQWGRFTNWNGGCFGVANNQLYFGGNSGSTFVANSGFLDVAQPIPWEIQASWQEVGGAFNKLFTMVRPTLLVGTGVQYAITVDVDFATTMPTGLLPALAPTAATMIWPWTWPGTWGGGQIVDQRWQSVGAIGTWASVHMVGTIQNGSMQCNAFEVGAMKGGPL